MIRFLLLLFASSLIGCGAGAVRDLRCEGRTNPLGVDAKQPRFSWLVDLGQKPDQQMAYQVLVASKPELLSEDRADLWNSGKVNSSRTFGIEYGGKTLTSALHAVWKIRMWNAGGHPSPWSDEAPFVMGLLDQKDWGAKWIGNREPRIRAVTNGYHATETKVDEPKWVQVDLGEPLSIDEIVLYPAKPDNWKPSTSGFGFPPAGKIEVADDATFQNPRLIARWEDGKTLIHGDDAVKFNARRTTGRYVRVTSEHLWSRQDGSLCFALAEVMATSSGKNRALGAAVTAKDSIENSSGWAMRGLTDGHAPGIPAKSDEFAAVLLRKNFAVETPIARATLSVCGLGYCIAEMNGKRIGDAELDPGFTAFNKRDLYVTYDVTRQLKQGANELQLTLGGGWFEVATPELFGFDHAPWSAPPRALVRLKLELEDGTEQIVVSDESWKTATGPIQFQCIRGGESIDLTREVKWTHALIVKAPEGKLQAQSHPPIRRDGEIPALELTVPQAGIYQFKLAENTSGWPKLHVKGTKGQKITLRSAEDFDAKGNVARGLTQHTFGRYQTEEYILPDGQEHTLEPHFTYHGFQYVRVQGLTTKPSLSDLVGVRVHTVLEPAGSFECSNPQINKIHEMCVRTYLANLHGIPTDCPQREKAGWMLDGYIASCIGMWNFRADTFYPKWARDMADAQAPDGSVPSIVPNPGWWELLDPWWGGASVMLPWDLFERYGDDRILREQYPVMKKYLEYLGKRAKDNLVAYALGDWLEVGAGGPANRTPVELTSSMAYFRCAKIVSETANLLDNTADARTYASLAQNIRGAINKKYLDPEHHRYAPDSQSASAMALVLGIAPDDQRQQVLTELVRNIRENRKGHVSTGIVGTRFLFEALHQGGHDDVAYAMVTQPDFPGWIHMMNNGATTAWESWDGVASRNHPALAVVDAWFYQAVAGITPDPGAIAFEKITIAPQPVGDLTWAKAAHNTLRGRIESNWKRDGARFILNVIIPPGTTATIIVPSRDGPQRHERAAGRYSFSSNLK